MENPFTNHCWCHICELASDGWMFGSMAQGKRKRPSISDSLSTSDSSSRSRSQSDSQSDSGSNSNSDHLSVTCSDSLSDSIISSRGGQIADDALDSQDVSLDASTSSCFDSSLDSSVCSIISSLNDHSFAKIPTGGRPIKVVKHCDGDDTSSRHVQLTADDAIRMKVENNLSSRQLISILRIVRERYGKNSIEPHIRQHVAERNSIFRSFFDTTTYDGKPVV